MSNNFKLGIECIPSSMFVGVETNADILWIHLDNEVESEHIDYLISKFVISANLKLVMTSGYMSEELHDRIDDVLEEHSDQKNLILTVWSEDSFAESLWEFINVHGSRQDIGNGKVLIIADTAYAQVKLLTEVVSTALAK